MREIELKPSRLLGLLLLGMTMLALGAVWLAGLPWQVRSMLGAAVIGLAVWRWGQARGLPRLRVTAAGTLQCPDEQGEWGEVAVLGDSLVTPVLIVLRYRSACGHVRSLTLLPDSAAADDLRRLRVLLRWATRTRSDTSSRGAG